MLFLNFLLVVISPHLNRPCDGPDVSGAATWKVGRCISYAWRGLELCQGGFLTCMYWFSVFVHQEFQVSKMEVLSNLISLFGGMGFPYISLTDSLYNSQYLHFKYLKFVIYAAFSIIIFYFWWGLLQLISVVTTWFPLASIWCGCLRWSHHTPAPQKKQHQLTKTTKTKCRCWFKYPIGF